MVLKCRRTLLVLSVFVTHTHTHTHACLAALCPGLPRWAGTRNVKTIWIILKQETVSDNGISWVIQYAICRLLQTNNHANTPPLSFLQAGCSSCHSANSVKALKAQLSVFVKGRKYTLYWFLQDFKLLLGKFVLR